MKKIGILLATLFVSGAAFSGEAHHQGGQHHKAACNHLPDCSKMPVKGRAACMKAHKDCKESGEKHSRDAARAEEGKKTATAHAGTVHGANQDHKKKHGY